MALTTTTSRATFTGNGATTVFPFPYYFIQDADLVVILTDTDGVETIETITTNYTVSGAGDQAGGDVTMLVAPPLDYTLSIYRDPEQTQTLELAENDPLPEAELVQEMDKLTMLAQRLADQAERTLKLPEGEATLDMTLPTLALRASSFLAFDADGQPTAVGGVTDVPVSAFWETTLSDTTAATSRASLGFGADDIETNVGNNKVLTTNGSGKMAAAATTTPTELEYVHGVTSAIQTQINGLLSGNYLPNSHFAYWQRGISTTIANGSSAYQADQYYAKNALGTNGVITYSQVAPVTAGSQFGASIKITTAPTAAQANGCEFYGLLEAVDSLQFYNQNASFSARIKALGNVTQVGIQFFSAATEVKPTVAIGSETLLTVNSSTFTLGSITNQAIGTSAIVVGFRIRITGVSSGNTYSLNNGFVVEQVAINKAPIAATWAPKYKSIVQEKIEICRFYEKSYDDTTDPGTASATNGQITFDSGATGGPVICLNGLFKVTKHNTAGTGHYYSPTTGTIDKARNINSSADTTSTTANIGQNCMLGSITVATGNLYTFHWTYDCAL